MKIQFMKIRGTFNALLASALLLTFPLVSQAEISEKDFTDAFKRYATTKEGQAFIGSTVKNYFMLQQILEQIDESQFKNPIKVEAGSSPSKGAASAKVTILEFSDFQCPYCSRVNGTITQVLKAYPNDVKVVFKQLPLDFHPHAKPAARAALAAGKQGKFWEMHDALFANQQQLAQGEKLFEEQAAKLGLDAAKFKADMASEEIGKQIEKDMADAKTAGIGGTPGFLVNGVRISGALPFEAFKYVIDRWLSPNPAQV